MLSAKNTHNITADVMGASEVLLRRYNGTTTILVKLEELKLLQESLGFMYRVGRINAIAYLSLL